MEKHIVLSMVYFSRLKNMMLTNRLEYVESMVGNLLPLPSLQRLDWTMFLVLHSGWLVMALNLKFYILLSQYQKIKNPDLYFIYRVPIARLAAAQVAV